MNKKIIFLSSIMICSIFVVSCGRTVAKDEIPTVPVTKESETANISNKTEATDKTTEATDKTTEATDKTTEATDKTEATREITNERYTLSLYTEAPNKNSSIKIQYPIFSGKNCDKLNTLVYDKVQSFAQIDTSLFSSDTGMTIDYQSAVTLQNRKIVSIVFWGTYYMDGAAYESNHLAAFNVDLQSMKEMILHDLYTTNADFEKVFFEKSFFPTDPITSYDKASFQDMLKLQTSEYQTVDPFSIADNVSCFFKPDGIVLSMPAVHATGSDHFEAQLKYSDIQQFYQLKQNYWED